MAETAFAAKRIYDGTGEYMDDSVMIVKDGIIDNILPYREFKAEQQYKNTKVTETLDRYMMPGLIDAHVHMMLPGDGTAMEEILEQCTEAEIALIARENLRQAFKAGITAVRDCGCAKGISYSLKKHIKSGKWLGPDLVVCGMPLTSGCGHCGCMGGQADGTEEIVKMIRSQRMNGADFCKIMSTSGATRGVLPGITFTQEELDCAVSEAHRLGMPVSAHATSYEAVKMCIQAGVDRLEHGWWINLEGTETFMDSCLAEKIKEGGIMTCPTPAVMLSTLEFYSDCLKSGEDPSIRESYEGLKEYNDTMLSILKYQIGCGIEIAAGSDAGWRHLSFRDGMYETLRVLQECGMNEREIMRACTCTAAKYIGMESVLGTLQRGMQADFVVLNGDPYQSLEAYHKIDSVYKKGIKAE